MLILREPRRNLEVTRGADGWQDFLADPPRHWKDNRAAQRLVESWNASAPLPPPEVRAAWASTPFADFEPTLAVPAYEVDMPGGRHPVQNDLLLVGPIGDDLAIVMVQGEVAGTLGPHIDEVLHHPRPGPLVRIGYLKRILELPDPLPESTCYHLLDRCASPLIEAQRLHARYAAMIVTAFEPVEACHDEYRSFARLFGISGDAGRLERVPAHRDPELWIGWVQAHA